MHTVHPQLLADLTRRFGMPRVLHWEVEIGPAEMEMVRASRRGWRSHDVTFFIIGPHALVALIRKPSFPPGVWRAPSGGVNPGEDFVAGTTREAAEETGLDITLERYLVRIHVTFRTPAGSQEPWVSHLFLARTEGTRLLPRDHGEIAGARWSTLEELTGPIRRRLLATGRGLFRYRALLHDAAYAALRGGPYPAPAE
ncbi:hypothetical protein caldi_21860 [Caldinitratiruptor microaerophilus]|uniref:Nudix hydrolase domain-containing protein n=2 Tax=Caldinitratiruptor microaerophilus TaxID=671077 RepID=A0AA35G6D2_9FIRM|nr:hypothetical protein caldi_21860 [Caldinitratiruptor microaerophilus]